MISILVCSINPKLLEQLQRNIGNTIGITFELLVFDNRKEKLGICAVYNRLAAQAKFDILCFVHEDVLFQTNNWGVELITTFSAHKDIGMVGVAGSKYKSAVFSGWYTGQKELDCANIIHRFKAGDERNYLNPGNNVLEEVVCIDGVFICCTKKIWAEVKFDEAHLKGFHVYDLDFSLRAAQITKLAVTFTIQLVHITEGGDFRDNWMATIIEYHRRQQRNLPYSKQIQPSKSLELAIARANIDFLKNFNISWTLKLKWILRQKLYEYVSFQYDILKFLLYRPLRLRYLHQLFVKK